MKISNETLTPDTPIFVEGEVVYSHVASHIDGEELEKDKQRKLSFGMSAIDKPYTTITIRNPKIIPVDKVGKILSTEEQYIQERFYQSKADDDYRYTINSKSPMLPRVELLNEETRIAEQINLQGKELATGLKVILGLRTFKPKNFTKRGIALDDIMVVGDIRFYSASSPIAEMMGVTIKPLSMEESRAAVSAITVEESAVTEVPQPGNEPYHTEPAKSETPVVPAEPAKPWICSCGAIVAAGHKFCGECGQPKADIAPPAPTTGIAYDPE